MRFSLARETGRSSFATRSVAAELRSKISESMIQAKSDQVLEVDFDGVEALTVSFADELVAKLVAERRAFGTDDLFLRISHASEEVAETIEVALDRRGLFVVHETLDGRSELLAGPAHLQETFAVAAELGRFSARQLAERMGLKMPAANNRIRALAEVGALVRAQEAPARGGRQYSYRVSAAA